MSVDDELPGKIKITKVEPTRVIFINKTNGRKEFLELPNEPTGLTLNPKLTPGGPTIEKTGKNQFNVSRVEVDNALADFNAILTQARAVPNFENGAAAGYKLFQIVPGSIYEKLGLQLSLTVTFVFIIYFIVLMLIEGGYLHLHMPKV